jgi:hypothetical protein
MIYASQAFPNFTLFIRQGCSMQAQIMRDDYVSERDGLVQIK